MLTGNLLLYFSFLRKIHNTYLNHHASYNILNFKGTQYFCKCKNILLKIIKRTWYLLQNYFAYILLNFSTIVTICLQASLIQESRLQIIILKIVIRELSIHRNDFHLCFFHTKLSIRTQKHPLRTIKIGQEPAVQAGK